MVTVVIALADDAGLETAMPAGIACVHLPRIMQTLTW